MSDTDAALLRAVAPGLSGARARAQGQIIAAIAPVLGAALRRHRIDTPLRRAHFLAQLAHESARFSTTEEFASGAAYEGRADLGNTEPGDGPRYKGRGLLQLTGRANYRRFGRLIGVDLEAEPRRAAEPRLSLRIACLYWSERGLNAPADLDDLRAVTRAINGGLNGLADRRICLLRAKAALGLGSREDGVVPPAQPLLGAGARGPRVAALQARLNGRGAALAVDGIYGPATALAVRRWQAQNGLAADGIAGPETWASLADTVADGEGTGEAA